MTASVNGPCHAALIPWLVKESQLMSTCGRVPCGYHCCATDVAPPGPSRPNVAEIDSSRQLTPSFLDFQGNRTTVRRLTPHLLATCVTPRPSARMARTSWYRC